VSIHCTVTPCVSGISCVCSSYLCWVWVGQGIYLDVLDAPPTSPRKGYQGIMIPVLKRSHVIDMDASMSLSSCLSLSSRHSWLHFIGECGVDCQQLQWWHGNSSLDNLPQTPDINIPHIQ